MRIDRGAREIAGVADASCVAGSTKFYVTCKCARRECGRTLRASPSLAHSLSLSLSLALCFFLPFSRSHLFLSSFLSSSPFLLPKRSLRNQFRCRPAALGLARLGSTNFFLHASARDSQVQKYYRAVAETASPFLSVKSPASIPRRTLRQPHPGI